MKLMVLGRDGQVGTALSAVLANIGDVVAFGHQGADFEHPELLGMLVKHERPDVIVNAAAHTAVDKAESEPDRARLVNATSPEALALAAAEYGAVLIHYSTDYVFDGSKSAPWVEDDATGPLSVYGTTKRDGELAIAAAGAPHLIFRTSWVHAPGGSNFIAKMLTLARDRDELKVIDDQVGAPTGARLISEVTRQAIEAIAAGRGWQSGIYHLAASGETTWNGYARFVIGEAIRRGHMLRATPDKVLPVPTSAFPTPARRPLNSRLDTGKLRAVLGAPLPSWQEGVLGTLDGVLERFAA